MIARNRPHALTVLYVSGEPRKSEKKERRFRIRCPSKKQNNLESVLGGITTMGNVEVDEGIKPAPASTPVSISSHESSQNDGKVQFNEQTNYLPTSKVIAVFLVCASVDFVTLMDQTTLAASLTIVSSQLDAGSQASWIAGGYFVLVQVARLLCWQD